MTASVVRRTSWQSLAASLVCVVLFQIPARAAQLWPEQLAPVAFTAISVDALPKELIEALLRFDEFSQGNVTLSGSLSVASVDLNRDGSDEYIVQSAQAYSGGPMLYAFEQRGDGFAQIADCQGLVWAATQVQGYADLVCQSRGGGGRFTRQLLRYQGERYETVSTNQVDGQFDGDPDQFAPDSAASTTTKKARVLFL